MERKSFTDANGILGVCFYLHVVNFMCWSNAAKHIGHTVVLMLGFSRNPAST